MPTIVHTPFTWPLGEDFALIQRGAALAEAQYELVGANHRRLARWFPDAYQEPPTREGVRADLEEIDRAWLDGTVLPLAIAERSGDGWRLAGWAQLVIDRAARSGDVGYWLDHGYVGRGLVTRAVTAILDHAFGPLGLERVGLVAVADNDRSRGVAHRLGFTQEGVLRECAAFPDGRRDVVLYGLLAREWLARDRRRD
jgi:ribosomal-protein-serine acetyltransferase